MSAQTAIRSGVLILSCLGCILRTAPAGGSSGAVVPPQSATAKAAEARLAGVPRVELLGEAGIRAFDLHGDVKKVDITPFAVEGQPFTDALRATIKEGSSNAYAVQLTARTTAAIDEGDAILATFYLRTERPQEGGVGETEFVLELAEDPYTKSIQYPVQAGADWAKVQVRFKAVRAYASGEANMILRLGYDTEIIEIGGVQVQNFGKRVGISALPNTQAADRRRERAAEAAAREAQTVAASAPPLDGGDLRFTVVPSKVSHPISPYIYGINSQSGDGAGVTVRRMGGNRQTTYNWENNASNAGSDYHHSSDDWPCTAMGFRDCTQPGAQFLDFATANKKAGMDTIATVPLVDYVTADKSGSVAEGDKAPSKRWNRSYAKKPGPYAATPDLSDGAVYQDEFVNFLVGKLGRAGQGGIKFYSLDNEPALWSGTHPRIHPEKTRYDEMVNRSEATAAEIVRLDPTAIVLGGVMYGWSEYMALQGAPDSQQHNATFGTYVDFFLAEMKRLEEKHHQRLVHVLDVHWYPEAHGTKRITEKDASPKTIAARMQAPRSLWDPDFVEKSWITDSWGKSIRLIPWLQDRIAARYPGTKLAMTEYNFGAPEHISGGLAQADVLGIFGREGLYLATYWGDGPGNGGLPNYIKAAFQLYRNYDGKGGVFGDSAVQATPADIAKASVYAATDSKRPGVLTVVVINKELRTAFNGQIALDGGDPKTKAGRYATAQVYALDGSAAAIRRLPDVAIKGNRIAYRLPPLSATLFVCGGPP